MTFRTDPYDLDLLPDVVPNARVLTFGYDTNIRHSLNGPISQNRLGDHAKDFLFALEGYRRQATLRPLIFVAHSLGGLLVKDMLRLSKAYQQSQPDRYTIFHSTVSLFFFGTPHAGADPRNTLHRVLTNITEALGFNVNKEIVQTLMPGAERSKLLAEDFLKWTSEHDWDIYTFQEEFAHSALGVKIVDDHSSSINDQCHERIVHIRANHVDMCRFTGADDPEFCKVSSAILRAKEKLFRALLQPHPGTSQPQGHAPPDTPSAKLSPEQIDKILEKLSFDGIDARYMTLKSAQRKTCQWLLKHQSLKSWAEPSQMDTHHGFLWIKGKPGTGKSISMKYLCQNAMRSKNGSIVLKFFFNARGTQYEHSTEGMYRSLLWQLIAALRDSGITSDTLVQFLSLEDAAVWPIEALKEAFSSILAQINHRELYCFVDALDECPEDEIRDMIYFFEEIGERCVLSASNVRVCFSSRHYPHITIRRGLQLVLEDEDAHSNDIRLYIQSKLRINHNRLRQKIEDEIFEKSSRIFLWAALVVDILNKENDKGGNINVQKRLRQIPRGLHDLFQDILTRDNENIEEMILCIQWILFAKRPLRPEELYFAIQCGSNDDASMVWDEIVVPMDRINRIDRINRFNLNVSKGLAEVTKKDATIQFIHESVRDYLLRENGLATLLLCSTPPRSFSEEVSHNNLRDICLAQVQVAQSAQESTLHENSPNMPFLRYAVTYVLYHADSAQGSGSDQSDFLSTFPLQAWVSLDNKLQRYKSRHHSDRVTLLYLLAEQNLASLIHIHPERHKSFTIFPKTERFPNPLVAAMASGNNEAIFALALECLKAYVESGQLEQIKEELSSIPQFKADLDGAHWKRMDTYSLVCYLDSVVLYDDLQNHIPALNNVKPEEMLGSFPRGISVNLADHIIQRGALVNAIDKDSNDTALMRAVKDDILTAAEFLLMKGADPNITISSGKHTGYRSLDFVESGSMIALLLRHGGSLGSLEGSLSRLSHTDWFSSALMGLPDDDLRSFLSFTIDGRTLLHCMAEYGGITAPLLRTAFNIDDTLAELKDNSGNSLIMAAINGVNRRSFEALLEVARPDINTYNKQGCMPLCLATAHGEFTMARSLLELGADPELAFSGDCGHQGNAVQKCIRTPSIQSMEYLEALLRHPSIDVNFRDELGSTPLSDAIEMGNSEALQLLLSHPSININSGDASFNSPLLQAISGNHFEIIKLLLSHPSIDINLGGAPFISPLLQAIRGNHLEIIKLLLSHPSIDINLGDPFGSYPLLEATIGNNIEIIKLLLSHPSIDANRPGQNGLTPLLNAAKRAPLEVVQLLLADSRVDRKVRCSQGQSVLDYARYNPDREVFELVQDLCSSPPRLPPDQPSVSPFLTPLGVGR
ncbi:ankyrin [Xylaria longipes]|nr:ankyrin [Xylaria longipes]